MHEFGAGAGNELDLSPIGIRYRRPNHSFGLRMVRCENGSSEGKDGITLVWCGDARPTLLNRIDHLRTTCAAVKFLSLEPLLGQLCGLDLTNIDWVIVGGESGPGARPMSAEWVRDIRDQCVRAGVPFFFKQWGGVNKKKAGRVLDGRSWDEMLRRASLPYNARSSPRSI